MSATPWSSEQLAIHDWFEFGTGNLVVEAFAGTGKCLGRGTPVLMHDGSVVSVESIKEGDLLMGPDSAPRKVLSAAVGYGPLYRIAPVKGDPWVCNDAHVMTLTGTNLQMGQTIDVALTEHLRASAARNERPDRNWKLFRVGVEFPSAPLPVEPYLVGLWMGDGTAAEPSITSADREIIEFCQSAAGRYGATAQVTKERSNAFRIRFRTKSRREKGRLRASSILRSFFRACVGNNGKRIPESYLVNDRQKRLELLAGIIDTDGFLSGGGYEIAQTSKLLTEQILFLARSLGICATCSTKRTSIKSTGYVGSAFRVFLSGNTDEIPCRLARKRAGARRQIKRHLVTGWTATPIGVGHYYGFTLDCDGRFLLGDFTVTHNTTTIVGGVLRAPEKRILLAAFGKKIALELQDRIKGNPRAEAKTLHAAGSAIVRRYWEKVFVDPKRDAELARQACGDQTPDAIIGLVTKLAVRVKETLLPVHHTASHVEALAEQIDCVPDEEWEDDGYDAGWVAKAALRQLDLSRKQDGRISYADMLFLPIVNNWVHGRYDLVVIDECQDMSVVQVELARRLCTRGGRICVVGDSHQAIFGFRGADSGSIARMTVELNAKVLPLTITRRCPVTVVAEAQRFVPAFQAAPNAQPGAVETLAHAKLVETAGYGDFILSRKNAPLASICISLLKAGKRARIEGRDIAGGLIKLVRRMRATTVQGFLEKLGNWRDREIERAASRQDPAARIEAVMDQDELLRALAEGCTTMPEYETRIDALFADTNKDSGHDDIIVCSSVHRAKGLEANRVFVLRETLKESGDQEERNICYVASTRAKRTLVYVVSAVPPAATPAPTAPALAYTEGQAPVAGPAPAEVLRAWVGRGGAA